MLGTLWLRGAEGIERRRGSGIKGTLRDWGGGDGESERKRAREKVC